MSDGNDDKRHLCIVDYEEDAERKRAEYLFNNWENGRISRPSGLVRIAEGVDHEELYEKLVAKVPAEQIEMYHLRSTDTEIEPETITVEKEVSASVDAVETFVQYIMSKKKAVLQSAAHNEYEVYTKKGRGEVSYELTDEGRYVSVRIRVTGYSPAPSFLTDFFETELTDYAASQASE